MKRNSKDNIGDMLHLVEWNIIDEEFLEKYQIDTRVQKLAECYYNIVKILKRHKEIKTLRFLLLFWEIMNLITCMHFYRKECIDGSEFAL